jgi:hypothetical protein
MRVALAPVESPKHDQPRQNPLQRSHLTSSVALHDHVLAALLSEELAHRKPGLASPDDYSVVTLGHGRTVALPVTIRYHR